MWVFVREKNRVYSENPTMKGPPMSRRHYGLANFLFDAILILLTGGLWLVWIFVREMRGLR